MEPACPRCGSLRVVRLARTTPSGSLFDKAELGRRVIEGAQFVDRPFMFCQDCGRQFEVARRRP